MLSALLGVMLAAPPLQQDPLPQKGELKPVSRAHYLGNNLRFEYSMKFVFKEVAIRDYVFYRCNNECRGMKHLVHEECDTSCDKACSNTHQGAAASFSETDVADANMAGAYSAAGGNAAALMQSFIMQAAQRQINAMPPQPFRHQHWNRTPCSVQNRHPKFNVYDVVCKVKVSRENRNVDGTLSHVTVLSDTEGVAGRVGVPTAEYQDAAAKVKCACSVIQEIKPDGTFTTPQPPKTPTGGGTGTTTGGGTGGTTGGQTGHLPDPFDKIPRASAFDLGIYGGGAWTTDWFEIGEDGFELPEKFPEGPASFFGPVHFGKYLHGQGPPVSDKVLDQFDIEVKLDNMVTGEVSGSNPFPVPFELTFQPGLTFDTDANGVQDCVLVAPMTLTLPPPPPQSGLWASIEDLPMQRRGQKVTAKVRVMCLEMQKAEPTPETKYKIRPPIDGTMAKIGQQIGKTRMRGPADQAKVWAYTDGATYDQIVKKVFPSPRVGAYGRALSELAEVGVDFNLPKFAKLIEPKLISQFGSDKATFWVTHMVAKNPKALEAWVKTGAAVMAPLLVSEYPDDKKHFARVVNILASRQEVECHRSALAILAAVPESSRAVLKEANLIPVWLLGLSPDKGVSTEALKLLDLYNPSVKEAIKLNVGK